MKNISKYTIYYISITFVISFTLGVFVDHYIIVRPIEKQTSPKTETEIQIQSEEKVEDKPFKREDGCTIYVDVGGSVVNPGVFCLNEGSLVIDAVNKAGGLSKESSKEFVGRNINLSQPLVNNQKIYLPYKEELVCELVQLKQEEISDDVVTEVPTEPPYTDIAGNNNTAPSNSEGEDDDLCVNINTATKEQLVTLNGIGDSTAEKIIQGRPYTLIEDILNVPGVGESTLTNIQSDICI